MERWYDTAVFHRVQSSRKNLRDVVGQILASVGSGTKSQGILLAIREFKGNGIALAGDTMSKLTLVLNLDEVEGLDTGLVVDGERR